MNTAQQSLWGLFIFSLALYYIPASPTPHVHIVYLGLINHGHDPLLTTKQSHIRLLSNVFSREEEAKEAMLYSYRRSFSGFAAMLNSTQATTLGSMEEVISVFKSKTLQLHTTRSWEFMGLASSEIGVAMPVTNSTSADNVVVGVFDTGVWPESGSFREDAGMPPVPPSWKGTCVKGEKFDPGKACNKKLVGARYYISGFEREFGPLNTSGDAEYRSPRDRLGHGTHTASTAVGAAVEGAGFFGLAPGTARGGAPRARLAAYKVCWLKDLLGQCSEADILKAFDDALADGVGVISASLGASPPLSPFSSSSDIGSFHAAQMGVLVVFSAGNDGLEASLVQNVSPWSVCVAASTIDRSYPTQLMLGNNISILGEGFILLPMKMRLVDGSKYFSNGACDFQRWKGNFATGSIVLCFSNVGSVTSGSAALAVLVANGSAMIFAEPLTRKAAQDDLLPSVHVDIYQGTRILYYIQSAGSNAMVQVMRSKTAVGRSPAPSVAYFSSRGPSSITPNILKPDITAPGVNILAAWPPTSPPSVLPIDGRSVEWNFDSGTSMSCPHVSGVAALLKSVHPDWSPAAVKSALMTTAYTTDTSQDRVLAGGTTKPADSFDMGSGHMNPVRAMNPGLVYDMATRDYVLFLCSFGYTPDQIDKMVIPSPGVDTRCPDAGGGNGSTGPDAVLDVNYPAIVVSSLRSTTTVKRTLRNVGRGGGAVYRVTVVSPPGVRVSVRPRFLVFSCHGDRNSYHVTLTPAKRSQGRYDFGEIVWSDGDHRVRSPLVVRVSNAEEGGGGDSGTLYSSVQSS